MQPSGMSILWPSLATTSHSHQKSIKATWKLVEKLTDDSAAQRHVASKVDIASDSQMVKFQDLGDLLEALLELLDLKQHKGQ